MAMSFHDHPTFPTTARLSIAACLALAACNGGGDSERGGECVGLLPGDLVITEIMANPAGEDKGSEWFEIYNATDNDIGLSGAELVASREDGTDEKRHIINGLVMPAGDYTVVGALLNDPEVLPQHFDYGYERDLGDFRNSAGRLVVECGGELIDEVLYLDPGDGASRGYTGDRPPDAVGNDDLNFWCDATSPFGEGGAATPGAANDICEGVGSPTECQGEDGEIRPVVAPVEGDLVITEFMPNPSAVGDTEGEWFEVYVGDDVDLNGLELSTAEGEVRATLLMPNCVQAGAGQRFVFARSEDSEINGGLPQVDATFDFSLGNTSGTLILGYGGQTLDQITWSSSSDGAASQLDPDFRSAQGNDDPGVFCAATQSYGLGDFGTPGAENDQCQIAPPMGMCFDGGELREALAPTEGDIVITEFHANPDAVGDADGEWFEILAAGNFDLNGVTMGREEGDIESVVEVEDCVQMTPGDYAVIARGADPAVNGGLPDPDAFFDFSLVNSNGRLWVGVDTTELDVITWSASTAGAASQLDPAASDPQSNDNPEAFCAATGAYGDGDLGTPGAENGECGGVPTGMCNDGGNEREINGPGDGDLVITEVMPDPSFVSDANGEWFEVLNTTGEDIDVNGLQLGLDEGDVDETLPASGDCLTIAAGDYAVFAHDLDPIVNGGLDADFEFGFGLTNAARSVFIAIGDTTLDVLPYDDATAGAAWTVDPGAEDPQGNDSPDAVCLATDDYGNGDLGTPGAQGPACEAGVGEGQCLDGGEPRDIVPAQAGDLVITEIMSNPVGPDGDDAEWFEVYVDADIDLNGVELSKISGGDWALQSTIDSADCIAVSEGSLLLFAQSDDPDVNGGLPAPDQLFSWGVNNTNTGLAVGIGGERHDEWEYSGGSEGEALQLDSSFDIPTPADNDLPANVCPATSSYGAEGNFGTPGDANDAC